MLKIVSQRQHYALFAIFAEATISCFRQQDSVSDFPRIRTAQTIKHIIIEH